MKARVAVLIVSWNTRELLRACVESVLESGEARHWQVIVIDNGSRDGSPEMVRRAFPDVRLLHNATNHGFARAVNQGFREARAEYVLLLNSDVRILDRAIERCAEFMDAAPKAAALGCRQVSEDGLPEATAGAFPTLTSLLRGAYNLGALLPTVAGARSRAGHVDTDSEPRAVDCLTGSFLMVRTSAVTSSALLDEGYFFYGEETDLCYGLQRRGWQVQFHPGIVVVHRHGGSSRAVPTWALWASRRARLKLLYRWRSPVIAWLANLLLLPRVLVASLLRLPTDPAVRKLRWAALRFHLAALVRPALLAGSWAAPPERPLSIQDQTERGPSEA